MVTDRSKLFGYLAIVGAAVAYGSYGIWTRYAGEGAGPYAIAFLRSVFAVSTFVAIAMVLKKWEKPARKDYKWLALFAFATQVSTFPFTLAVLETQVTLGEVLFLFYAGTILVSYILAYILFAEKINAYKILSLILAMLGLLVMYQVTFEIDKLYGFAMALLAGAGFGMYGVFSKKVSDKYSNEYINIIGLSPFLITAPLFMLATGEQFTAIDGGGLFWSAVYGLSAVVAGYTAIVGYKLIEAQKASLVLLLEPVVATLAGFLFFQESLPEAFAVAAVLILIASALPTLKNRKRKGT